MHDSGHSRHGRTAASVGFLTANVITSQSTPLDKPRTARSRRCQQKGLSGRRGSGRLRELARTWLRTTPAASTLLPGLAVVSNRRQMPPTPPCVLSTHADGPGPCPAGQTFTCHSPGLTVPRPPFFNDDDLLILILLH